MYGYLFVVLRFRLPAQEVSESDQGRVKATFFVQYTLAKSSDIDNLKEIKRKVREAGGKIEPTPTVKRICRNASVGWFLPQMESSDDE